MSKIEWCDETWNPIAGCSDVSEGCRNCYARTMARRLSAMRQEKYYGLTTLQGSKTVWTGKISFDEKALLAPLRRKRPTRYFVNSMSDLFHPNVTDEMRDRIYAVMALCQQHTFLVLTKRPELMMEYTANCNRISESRLGHVLSLAFRDGLIPQKVAGCGPIRWPLPNLWLGISAERQKEFQERIEYLEDTPAAIRYVSYEPALDAIDFMPRMSHLDWIIVGGESGPGARPFNVEWARSTVQQCAAAGVACFVKQMGVKPVDSIIPCTTYPGTGHVWTDEGGGSHFVPHFKDRKGGDMSEWPEDLRVRQFPEVRS